MKYTIKQYPETIEECHRVIDSLVAELNQFTDYIHTMDEEEIDATDVFVPYGEYPPLHSKKFHTRQSQLPNIPHGLNGPSENDCGCRKGRG